MQVAIYQAHKGEIWSRFTGNTCHGKYVSREILVTGNTGNTGLGKIRVRFVVTRNKEKAYTDTYHGLVIFVFLDCV